MKIRIIAVGKVKDEFLKNGITFYLTKIRKYADIVIDEVSDSSLPDNPRDFDIEKAKQTEGERISKLIKPSDYVINLDLGKKEFTSEQFAKYFNEALEISGAHLTFVIGGSYGLSEKIKNRANASLSLSKMTFLHTMTRLIFLEQIYRAFKINSHETYHK